MSYRIITIEDVAKAIERDGIDKEVAQDIAEKIMNFFGYSNKIIDNILFPEDRQIFNYVADTLKILKTSIEQIVLPDEDHKEYRLFFWQLNPKAIFCPNPVSKSNTTRQEDYFDEIYLKEVPEKIWRNRNT